MAGRKRKKKRNRYRKHIIIWILLLLVTAHFCGGKLQQTLHKMPGETDWELIVVNKWNTIPDGYQTELTTLSNGKQVDSRIYPALQDLFDAMRADGIYPIVREGYRTTTDQQSILDDKIKAYEQEGLSSLLAKKWHRNGSLRPVQASTSLGLLSISMRTRQNPPMMKSTHGWQNMPGNTALSCAIPRIKKM